MAEKHNFQWTLNSKSRPTQSTQAAVKGIEYVKLLHDRLDVARKIVKELLSIVQEKAKERYDEGRREVTYNPGDFVLVYRPNRKVGKADKLNHYFIGPMEVIKQVTPVNY